MVYQRSRRSPYHQHLCFLSSLLDSSYAAPAHDNLSLRYGIEARQFDGLFEAIRFPLRYSAIKVIGGPAIEIKASAVTAGSMWSVDAALY